MGQSTYKGRPGAGIGRALLDATGITGIQEAWSGKDVATGRKLTPGEITERGTLGAITFLTLLLGGRSALKKAPGGAATDPVFPGRKSPPPDAPEIAPAQKLEPAKPAVPAEPPKLEPPKTEPPKTEPPKTEPPKAEPAPPTLATGTG